MDREMFLLRATLGGAHLLTAALLIAVSIPLLRKQIPMNRWYGVRLRKSFSSEENWYAINRYGALQMISAGIVLALIAIASFLLPVHPDRWYFWPLLFAPVLVLIRPMVNIFRFARRLP